MTLIAFLSRLVQQYRRASAVPPATEEVVVVDEDRPLGCGWFDSSHELQCGLQVQENLSAEALAAELPLAQWLEMQLGSWGVTRAA